MDMDEQNWYAYDSADLQALLMVVFWFYIALKALKTASNNQDLSKI